MIEFVKMGIGVDMLKFTIKKYHYLTLKACGNRRVAFQTLYH